MKKTRLPKTDSIKELAEFWDHHDLTDFEDELEEVAEPVFARRTEINVPLDADEMKAIERLAQTKGVTREELLHSWVREKLTRRGNGRASKR